VSTSSDSDLLAALLSSSTESTGTGGGRKSWPPPRPPRAQRWRCGGRGWSHPSDDPSDLPPPTSHGSENSASNRMADHVSRLSSIKRIYFQSISNSYANRLCILEICQKA
jgi:hypothetical protein